MEHFFIDFFQANSEIMKNWGVTILFFVAFIESLPILGTFLPGQTTIIFGGFLAKLGFFGLIPALIATILGAVLGDLTGYLLGKKYGPWILKKEKWIIDRKHYESTVRLIEGNSIKSIFLGRIHSFARTLMPFAAGMSKISPTRFIIIDIITAIIWATLCLIIGFVFGKSFELAATFISKFFVMVTLIAIVIIVAISHIRAGAKKLATVDATLLGISVTFLYLFAVTVTNFSSGKFFRVLDLSIERYVVDFHYTWLSAVMMFFTALGGSIVMPILACALSAYLLAKKRLSDAIFVATTLGVGVILVNIMKAYFLRPRPLSGFADSFGTSFPSGHAMMAAMFAIVIYYVVLRKIVDERIRVASYVFVAITAFAIGLSRVYLNVHWASDVFGGFTGGVFLATFMIVIFRLLTTIINKSRKTHSFPDIP